MNIYAAIFIIPFTVVLYTSTGGLKVGSIFWSACVVFDDVMAVTSNQGDNQQGLFGSQAVYLLVSQKVLGFT